MFYLDSRVHLDKVWMILVIHKEFQCSRIPVTHFFHKADRAFKNLLTNRFRYGKGRRIFNHLLMTALYRTVTVIKMYRIAVFIGNHLNLDMFRTSQIFFNENLFITKSFSGFFSGFSVSFFQFVFRVYDTHTAAAAAVRCFQHHRITDKICRFLDFIEVFHGFINARYGRNVCCHRHFFGRNFITHRTHHICGRSDKCNTALFTCLCEVRIF